MSTINDGQELLAAVLKAHGGLERWNKIEKIEVTWNFYGNVLEFKGFPGTRRPTITIQTRGEPSTVITGLNGDPENRWKFTAEYTSIESVDGAILQERSQPRSAYKGHNRRTPWDEQHLLYFISYAMYNYICAPLIFALPGFSVEELDSHSEHDETWRVLRVTHPDNFPAHTKIQRYYFDNKDFLLRRVDYETDVAQGVASHYCYDHKSFGGVVIPTLRRVVRRDADGKSALSGPTSFGLQYVDVKIFNQDGSVDEEGTRI